MLPKLLNPTLVALSIVVSAELAAAEPEWIRNVDDAKALANKRGKDLLIVFTGHGWCAPCDLLDRNVFRAEGFLERVSQDYVLVELDDNFGISEEERTKAAQLKELSERYLVRAVPTIVLGDDEGKPFSILTGYDPELDSTQYLETIVLAADARKARDSALREADSLLGAARARKLDEALDAVASRLGSLDERGADPLLKFYGDYIEEILELTAAAGKELADKYRARQLALSNWKSSVVSRIREFGDRQDNEGALVFIQQALETTENSDEQLILKRARVEFQKRLGRYEDALASLRILLDEPNLSALERSSCLDWEAHFLTRLGQLDEALRLYDKRLTVCDDPAERRRLLGGKAHAIHDRGPLSDSIKAWREYQDACEHGTRDWLSATILLARQLRQSNQPSEALAVLEKALAVERDFGVMLDAAECQIELGNEREAELLMNEAEQAGNELARSESNLDQIYAERIHERLAELRAK